jgi:hypothetical protein
MPVDFAEVLIERTKCLALVEEIGADFDKAYTISRGMS